MSRKSKPDKLTYTRFVYSVIDFLTRESALNFDVSSYITNDSNNECEFARTRICRFIQRCRKNESKNRFFITISLNHNGTRQEGREIIQKMVDELYERFLNSSCMEILKQIDDKADVEMLCTKNHTSLTDYFILLVNVSNESSIEFIIPTDSITQKLIERDENGEAVEYNSKLNKNLRIFKENLRK